METSAPEQNAHSSPGLPSREPLERSPGAEQLRELFELLEPVYAVQPSDHLPLPLELHKLSLHPDKLELLQASEEADQLKRAEAQTLRELGVEELQPIERHEKALKAARVKEMAAQAGHLLFEARGLLRDP